MNTITSYKNKRDSFIGYVLNKDFSNFFLGYSAPTMHQHFDIELAYLLKEFDDKLPAPIRLRFEKMIEQQLPLFNNSTSMPTWLIEYCKLLAKIPHAHDPYRIQDLRVLTQQFDNSLELRFILAASLAQYGASTSDTTKFTESQAIFNDLAQHLDTNYTIGAFEKQHLDTRLHELFAAAKVKALEHYASCLLAHNHPEKAAYVLENAILYNHQFLKTEHTVALQIQVRTIHLMQDSHKAFTYRTTALLEKQKEAMNAHQAQKNIYLSIFLGVAFLFPMIAGLITINSKLSFDQLVRVIIATGLTALAIIGFSILLTNTKSKIITILMLTCILGLLAFILFGLTPIKSIILAAASYAYHSIMG